MSVFDDIISRSKGNSVRKEDILQKKIDEALYYFSGKPPSTYSMVYYKNSQLYGNSGYFSVMIFKEILYKKLVDIAHEPGFEGFVLTDAKGIDKLINENKQ